VRRGCIFRRGSGYVVKVEMDRDPETGKRRYYWKGGFRTKKEAQEHLVRVLAEMQQGAYRSERMTVAQLLDLWLANKQIVEATRDHYARSARRVAAYLGRVDVRSLRPEHLQQMYAAMRADGATASMMVKAYQVIHQALDAAVRMGIIPRNPHDLVPTPKPPQREVSALTPEQVRRLLDVAKGSCVENMLVLVLTTGLRRGEIAGLRWDDVDLERGLITVRHSMDQRRQLRPTKTARGRRPVELTAPAIEALRREKAKGRSDVWVFATKNGTPWFPQNISAEFRRLLDKAGLRGVRLHDLRHTHATLMLLAGANPKVVQERLGHADVRTTLNIYSHVLPGIQRAAAQRVDEIIGLQSGCNPAPASGEM